MLRQILLRTPPFFALYSLNIFFISQHFIHFTRKKKTKICFLNYQKYDLFMLLIDNLAQKYHCRELWHIYEIYMLWISLKKNSKVDNIHTTTYKLIEIPTNFTWNLLSCIKECVKEIKKLPSLKNHIKLGKNIY